MGGWGWGRGVEGSHNNINNPPPPFSSSLSKPANSFHYNPGAEICFRFASVRKREGLSVAGVSFHLRCRFSKLTAFKSTWRDDGMIHNAPALPDIGKMPSWAVIGPGGGRGLRS